jgi:hypothetical protein
MTRVRRAPMSLFEDSWVAGVERRKTSSPKSAAHLAEEADERHASGLPEDQAKWAACRDLGQRD